MSSGTLVSGMGPGELVLVILACGIGALLIGAVGIGGVVILPALLVVGVQPAVGICSIYIAFMPAACAKLLVLGRIRGLIPWRAALSCGSTAAIGAAIGGVLVESSPRRALTYLVGVFAALAGARDAWELYSRKMKQRGERRAEDGRRIEEPGDSSTNEIASRPRGDDAKRSADGTEEAVVKLEISAPPPPRSCATFRERVAAAYMSADSIPEDLRWNVTEREMAILAAMGLFIGCASVLTGTGGPPIPIRPRSCGRGRADQQEACPCALSRHVSGDRCKISMSVTGVAGRGADAAHRAVRHRGMATGARILQFASREFLQAAMTTLLLAVAALTISKAATD